jgi:hypothetical protein
MREHGPRKSREVVLYRKESDSDGTCVHAGKRDYSQAHSKDRLSFSVLLELKEKLQYFSTPALQNLFSIARS